MKISVLQQTLSKDIISVPMNLHSAYIRQVHQSTWNLLRTVRLLTLWKQERSLRQHSADHALVPEIHLRTTHSLSATQPETSRTVKVPSFRADRSHPLHLWMHVPSQQQQPIRDSLHLQLIWMWNIKDRLITLTRTFTQTVYLTAMA